MPGSDSCECPDCVVHPRGAIPSGYHLAVHDQVIDHKQWILNTLDKWAVAKYETGYVSMKAFWRTLFMSLIPRFLDMVMVMVDQSSRKRKKTLFSSTWLFAKLR